MTTSTPICTALVGVGKIALDQHAPALMANPSFRLVAGVDPGDQTSDLARFATLDALLDVYPDLQAVAVCTPPQARYRIAALALDRGLHVFLEKPPCATLGEVDALRRQAARTGRTLFAGWHSRFAAAVTPARQWLADKQVRAVRVDWREDVRKWHPGQQWIWQAGGLGVFDPGINALSILTAILPTPIFLESAELRTPANRAAPVAADLVLSDETGVRIEAGFDWLQTGPQTWDIVVETDAGVLRLTRGGSALFVDDALVTQGADTEYPGLYRRFAALIAEGASEVDDTPLRLVADAFLRATRVTVAPFED